MYSFEKLKVWKAAMGFCGQVYKATSDFPSSELYGLTSQLRRASASIPLNIAEGSSVGSKREFVRFLRIAMRSEYELATALKLARMLKYLDDETCKELESDLANVGRMLRGLMRSVDSGD